jgi:lambda family phage portal protein
MTGYRPSLLARAFAAIAPAAALRREQARMRLAMLRGVTARYEGASRSPRMDRAGMSVRSADGVIGLSASRLRAVSRDMERNNPYGQRIFTVIPTNIVGAGIVPSIKADSTRVKAALQRLVSRHLESTAIDFDGRHDLYGLQFLAVRAMARDGEALIVRMTPNASARLPVPMQLRVLEADYLDTLRDGPIGPDGGFIVQGVEFDKAGRRTAYWLFDQHPGDAGERFAAKAESRRVKADDVVHLYRTDRAGQTRGVPWITPAIVTLWDLKDYEEAELVRQRVAACFAAFVTGPGSSSVGASVADGSRPGVDILKPGTIQHLGQMESVTFSAPPQVHGYSEFVRQNLRKIASATGVPFNEIASDDSQENFSSSRRGYLVFQRLIDTWRWQVVIPQMCDAIGRWFLDAATIPLGRSPAATMEWTPPRRELISPKEEIAVMRDLVRGGFSSRSEQVRTLGYDPEAVEDEIAEENNRSDVKKLQFDSDGRNPMKGPLATQGQDNGGA